MTGGWAATNTLREALALYGDPESWEVISRSSSDWNEYQWQGDDGREHAWELAAEAVERIALLETALDAAEAERAAVKDVLGTLAFYIGPNARTAASRDSVARYQAVAHANRNTAAALLAVREGE